MEDCWSWIATAFEAILGGLEEVVGDSEDLGLGIKAFMSRVLGLMLAWTFVEVRGVFTMAFKSR